MVVPALAILALEWGGTLGGMTLGDKLGNALFQSVTLRTAGFNSIDLAAIQPFHQGIEGGSRLPVGQDRLRPLGVQGMTL